MARFAKSVVAVDGLPIVVAPRLTLQEHTFIPTLYKLNAHWQPFAGGQGQGGVTLHEACGIAHQPRHELPGKSYWIQSTLCHALSSGGPRNTVGT